VKGAALEGEVTAGNEAMKAAQGPVNRTSFSFLFLYLRERENVSIGGGAEEEGDRVSCRLPAECGA